MKRTLTNLISTLFGKFASHEFSPKVQGFINRSYVKLMKLDMSDFNEPDSYASLNALFTRALLVPRSFDTSKEVMISPCDSFITECGALEDFEALQIKGMAYDVRDFLTPHIDVKQFESIEQGSYINFYLSPKDYHRYHVPVDMRVKRAIHVPGKLYPVNIPSLKKRLNLFIENERVVLECEHEGVPFYLVLVGALNVGKMVVHFEEAIETNSDARRIKTYDYDDVVLKKGEELGYFKMGSTIIFIGPKEGFEMEIDAQKSVRFGQSIGRFKK